MPPFVDRDVAEQRYPHGTRARYHLGKCREGGARVEAAETIDLLDRLIAAGYKKFWIAKELGAKGERPGLQVGRNRRFVSVRNARKVHALYVRLQQADKRLAWISEQYSPAPAEHSVRRARRSGRAA